MKPETVITALQDVAAKQSAENSQRITDKLSVFTTARDTHAASMQVLKEIDTSIQRCKQERQTALDESAEAEQDWRSRFRTLRGSLTPEMKAEHSKRIASRELADEFTGLIAELETDKSRAMLEACATGRQYVDEHATALTVCAQAAWTEAMDTISPALVRAYRLRLRELELKGEPRPGDVLAEELQQHVALQAQFYTFDMDNEPVISQLGLHRPPLTGVDMTLYKSPVKRNQLAAELAARKKQAES